MIETERKFQSNVADQLMRKILSHTESSMLWSCNDLLSLSEAIRRELNAAHAEDQNRIRDLESQLATARRDAMEECLAIKRPSDWGRPGKSNGYKAFCEGLNAAWDRYLNAIRAKLEEEKGG